MQQSQGFSDREIASALLNAHKLSAGALTNMVLESSNPAIRQEGIRILEKTFQHQKQLWDFMNQKGFYQVDMAPQQDIAKARQQLQQQMGM